MRKKIRSLPISEREKEKLRHEINSVFYARYKAKENCIIHNGNFTYYFINHGFDNYEIIFKQRIF